MACEGRFCIEEAFVDGFKGWRDEFFQFFPIEQFWDMVAAIFAAEDLLFKLLHKNGGAAIGLVFAVLIVKIGVLGEAQDWKGLKVLCRLGHVFQRSAAGEFFPGGAVLEVDEQMPIRL